MVRYLTDVDVERLNAMPRVLELVELAWKDRALARAADVPRSRALSPQGVLSMLTATAPALGDVGFKYYDSTKAGATRHIHLVNANTGALEAIIEADRLGAMRTAAATGIATRQLAKKTAKTLGQIGAGGQGLMQIAGVHDATGIDRVKVYARTREALVDFCAAASSTLAIDVAPANSAQDAFLDADAVNLITRSKTPVMRAAWRAPGQHISAAGSNALDRREIDLDSFERCDVIAVDARRTAENECGDLAPWVALMKIEWRTLTEIGDVITGQAIGRTHDGQISLFESHGMGLQDLYVAVEVLKRAREEKLGIALPMGS